MWHTGMVSWDKRGNREKNHDGGQPTKIKRNEFVWKIKRAISHAKFARATEKKKNK